MYLAKQAVHLPIDEFENSFKVIPFMQLFSLK